MVDIVLVVDVISYKDMNFLYFVNQPLKWSVTIDVVGYKAMNLQYFCQLIIEMK